MSFFNNFEETYALIEDRIDVLILKPDFEVDGSLQQIIDLNGSTFELHVIVTINNISESKWDGVVYSWYGGINHQSCWYQKRNSNLPLHTPDESLSTFNLSKTHIAVYVRTVYNDIQKLKNNYLVYMGGQKHIFCGKHQLPLISSSQCDNKCSVIDH